MFWPVGEWAASVARRYRRVHRPEEGSGKSASRYRHTLPKAVADCGYGLSAPSCGHFFAPRPAGRRTQDAPVTTTRDLVGAIKDELKAAHVTYADVAEALGLSQSSV